MSAPAAPASQVYTWEPSNAAIARRYGLRAEQVLRFDTNTSPIAPEWLAGALAGPFDPPLNEYPDSAYEALTGAAAAYVGVDPTEVIVGAGADEVLDLVGKAFLTAGAGALVPVPTYSMYGVLSSQRAARLVSLRRLGPDGGFALDVERVTTALPDVAVIWLCEPNNPTGAAEPSGAVEAILEAAAALPSPPLVVVDEAYHEFTGRTYVDLRGRFPNLLVVRTLSKSFALPGIRVGFGVAARETIARLERVRPPGSISTVSAHVATVALGRPADARATVSRIQAARDGFVAGLEAAGWSVSPSVTNFVLARVGSHEEAEAAADRLLRAGIVPRTFGPANPLRGYLRLTVRTPEQNERLLEQIR